MTSENNAKVIAALTPGLYLSKDFGYKLNESIAIMDADTDPTEKIEMLKLAVEARAASESREGEDPVQWAKNLYASIQVEKMRRMQRGWHTLHKIVT